MCKKRFELIIVKYLKRIRVAPLRLRHMKHGDVMTSSARDLHFRL